MPWFYDRENGQWGQSSVYKLKANCSGSCSEKNQAGLFGTRSELRWQQKGTVSWDLWWHCLSARVPLSPQPAWGAGYGKFLRSPLGQTTFG